MESDLELRTDSPPPRRQFSRLKRAKEIQEALIRAASLDKVSEELVDSVGTARPQGSTISNAVPRSAASDEAADEDQAVSNSRLPSACAVSSGPERISGANTPTPEASEAESSRADSQDVSERPKFYNEEDELEAYFARARNRSPLEEGHGGSASEAQSSDANEGSGAESQAPEQAAGGGTPASADGSEADLNAETQRFLRERAANDRIGATSSPPKIEPMDDVLAKIQARLKSQSRKMEARRTLAPHAAPAEPTGQPTPALDAAALDRILSAAYPASDDGELLVVADEPSEATGCVNDEAALLEGASNAVPSEAEECMGAPPAEDASAVTDRERTDGADEVGSTGGSPAGERGSAPPSPASGTATSRSGSEAASEGGEDTDEEEELTDSGSSSASDDEGRSGEESPGGRERALAEARLMLRDSAPKRRGNFFEEEAEMSDDEGHSDDGSGGSGDDDEHAEILEDLIGHERDRKGDEKRRAALHAQWQAERDDADVKRLFDGVRNGFRRGRDGPAFLDGEEGRSLADARRRRAAVAGAADGAPGSGAESASEAESESGDEMEVDAGEVSDEEARAALLDYQAAKRAKLDQKEPDSLELGDTSFASYFESLAGAPRTEAQQQAPDMQTKLMAGFQFAATDAAVVTETFVGRQLTSNASRQIIQGNSRSFVWRDESQDAAREQVDELNKAPGRASNGSSRKIPGGHKQAATTSFGRVRPGREPLAARNGDPASFFEQLRASGTDDIEGGPDPSSVRDISSVMTKLVGRAGPRHGSGQTR